jgi:uncharacterized protein YutE (UPF0331/DUF86 family)
MAINRELVERKISLILQDLARLALSDYLADFKNELLAERLLERIIGRMIDINYHVITEQTLSAPTDYHGSFVHLGKMSVLSDKDAARFAKLSGLRNRLSHEYNGIDEAMIHQAVKEWVAELPTYLEAIKSFLNPQ